MLGSAGMTLVTTVFEAFEEAVSHHVSGRLMEAEDLYQRILIVDASNEAVIRNLFILYWQQADSLYTNGDKTSAIHYYELAFELKPDYPHARDNVAAVYGQIGMSLADEGNLTDALKMFERAYELNPTSTTAIDNLSEMSYRLGREASSDGKLAEGVALLERAVALGCPLEPVAGVLYPCLLHLARQLIIQGDINGSITNYKKALALSPSMSIPEIADIEGLIEKNRCTSAMCACSMRLANDPNHPITRRLLSAAWDKRRWIEARSPLLHFRKNIYSQNGEDGVLEEILLRLNITKGWFCEFGAWDGVHFSNTFLLAESRDWSGVYIEGDDNKFKDLKKTCARFPSGRLTAVHAIVQDAPPGYTLDSLLIASGIPEDFHLLSIDIDSIDYLIWKSLSHYRPIVVVIEVDNTIAPPEVVICNKDRNFSSLSAMINLANKKGYSLVCHTGNAIFVRNDRVADVGLSPEFIESPEAMFLMDWL